MSKILRNTILALVLVTVTSGVTTFLVTTANRQTTAVKRDVEAFKAEPVKPQQASREISGEIFIVLKSRETLKMSLVDVHAVDDKLAERILLNRVSWTTNDFTLAEALKVALKDENVTNMSWEKCLSTLASALGRARLAQNNVESRIANARQKQREHESNVKTAESRRSLIKLLPDSKMRKEWDANEEYREKELLASIDSRFEGGRDLESIGASARVATLESVQSEFFRQLSSATTIKTVTTDSEGKFALKIPGLGRYHLLARAQRESGNAAEQFTWLVALTDESAQRVILSNNNLVSDE